MRCEWSVLMKGSQQQIQKIYSAERYFRRNESIVIQNIRHTQYTFPTAELHRREFWKIVYIEEGSGLFCINGHQYPFCPGFLYLSHPNDLTSLELTQNIQLYNILFKKEFLESDIKRLFGDYQFFSLFNQEFQPEKSLSHSLLHILDTNRNIFTHIKKMEREQARNDANTAEMLRYYLLELLVELSRLSAKSYKNRRQKEIIQYVDRYLQDHFRDQVTPSNLAGEIGISLGYLFSIYQKWKHCSMGRQLLILRLNALKQDLLQTDESIERLCYRSGFSDLTNLYKVFKREENMTPKEFRNNARNSQTLRSQITCSTL